MRCDCIDSSFVSLFRCDADPQALAKYVIALIKKEKSAEELKPVCLNQLDVFLQESRFTLLMFS